MWGTDGGRVRWRCPPPLSSSQSEHPLPAGWAELRRKQRERQSHVRSGCYYHDNWKQGKLRQEDAVRGMTQKLNQWLTEAELPVTLNSRFKAPPPTFLRPADPLLQTALSPAVVVVVIIPNKLSSIIFQLCLYFDKWTIWRRKTRTYNDQTFRHHSQSKCPINRLKQRHKIIK